MSLEEYTALKKSRSSLNGAVTRLRNRYLRVADNDPNTFELGNMAASLTSLDTTVKHFYASQEEIMEFDDSSNDTPFNESDELSAIIAFEDSVDSTKSHINRLMATKRMLRASTGLHSDIDNLEELISSNPDQDYSATHSRITSSFQSLRSSIYDSAIREDHLIHRDLSLF